MLKLYRVTKVKEVFLGLVYVFIFDLFEFSAAIFGEGSIAAFSSKYNHFGQLCVNFVKLHAGC